MLVATIRVKGLSKKIGGKTILKNIDLLADSGQVVNIVGKSGAGKSMLLKCINRLVEPSSGDILVGKRSIMQMDPVDLRKKVGMVFQEPVMFHGTVWENLLYGLDVNTAIDLSVFDRTTRQEAYDKRERDMKELLARVGLKSEFLERRADRLSGGEKQRVAIARALGANPEALLMDEPTSALDADSKKRIEKLVLKLNAELGVTILIVTHDTSQARRMGESTLVLEMGRVKWFGPTKALGGDFSG